MIAFGCSITEPDPYVAYVEPGLRLAAEPDSAVLAYAAVGSIGRSYNLLLDAASRHEDLEALVLVHPFIEIADPDFCAKVRDAFADPDVAVVGCAGATGVRTIAWWEGSVSAPGMTLRYQDHGGGEVPAYAWAGADTVAREVDVVDGNLLVLSPWAVRNVRFDESLVMGHGFDFDYCMRVRCAGRKVITADLKATYHSGVDLIPELSQWVECNVQMAERWDGRMPASAGGGVPTGAPSENGAWKDRARLAEAKREAARAMAYSHVLAWDARVQALEREIEARTQSLSWRATRPLRQAVNVGRRAASRRRSAPGQGGAERNRWWR